MPINRLSPCRNFRFLFIIGWLVVIVSIFIYSTSARLDDSIASVANNSTEPSLPCRLEYFDSNQCQFVHRHCSRIDHLGLIPYLKWYFCAVPKARGGLIVALSVWLVIVFAAMATAADKFLAVNLASLVHSLDVSENLAGVTIFAFGNGSSDLFSTLAAMNGGNGSLAIAELFGAAAFITAMVIGSIAIIRPFNVDRRVFLGDVVCFIVAASVNLILISDGKLELWESFVIIGLYVSFVAYVLVRDHQKGNNVVKETSKQGEHSEDTEAAIHAAEETTALLIHNSPQLISLRPEDDKPKSRGVSSKTVAIEQITEDNDSHILASGNVRRESSSVCDWASEYEHMADTPPFIKLCSAIKSFQSDSIGSFMSSVLRLPATILIGLTTITQPEIEHSLVSPCDTPKGTHGTVILRAPERHPREYQLLCTQLILGPQFITWVFWSHTGTFSLTSLGVVCTTMLCFSILFLFVNRATLLHPGPYLNIFLSTAGFLTATAWIYVLASEAVALIETFGVISNINDALLGATVFAIGNSSDDIFANISVAKRGHPVLASAACLGGPMLNTLLGIGFGSVIQIVRGGYQPYVFHVPASLFVSAASLLTGLSVVLLYVSFRAGRLDNILGYGLVTLWIGFTAVNIYVSMGA